ncbi:MAG: biopolymer transporter ExbD [Gammaproteobacteria bacterium]|jgi:biopolymer transport protein ExbD|nr:biopolymer transporter ExbD [Gammaproteobacteria bacterium]MBT3489262.1 biopolymer transporter ExbD [Gammaproteobacteria bacterium]MBT3717800.1 biopolymer transporter ExbD [Gammaproteobacteria bacterium]MBT3843610.1 biopolymer transporter ExbD [Gammaproteobacteria bacterium]MBT3894046.1 biopolymer transporter ExbD [Gammaproteobacteria bacterium]
MQFQKTGTRSKRRWLSLTSLIDVVFLLLIFFMLTTSFSQQRMMSLDIPANKGKGQSAWQGGSLVRVHSNGELDLNGKTVKLSELSMKTNQHLLKRPDARFIVRPDPGLRLQEVIAVMDQLRVGGAEMVSLIR